MTFKEMIDYLTDKGYIWESKVDTPTHGIIRYSRLNGCYVIRFDISYINDSNHSIYVSINDGQSKPIEWFRVIDGILLEEVWI